MIQFLCPLLAAISASLIGVLAEPKSFARSAIVSLAIAILCWLGMAGSQWALTQLPDFSGLEVFLPNQVWQRILWPLGLVLLASVAITLIGNRISGATRVVLIVIVFGLAIFASLPFAPIWEDLVPENATWLLVSLMTATCNYHAISTMSEEARSESGRRWAMWLLVANFGAIAGVMFSQIGSLGEWCVAAMLLTTVIASAISISGKSSWAIVVLPALCLLAACLVANIRFNAAEVKPWWVFLILFATPTLIATVDIFLENRLSKGPRVAISAGIGFALSATVIAWVWTSSPSH